MADVYATLADGGYRNAPIAITKVVFPDGQVDENWGRPHRVKVLSEAVTSVETSILEQNVESGTATRSAINCPTAAKTGTTEELIDAWLDGYTPDYATAVWMGYPTRRVSMTDVHGEPQQGGYLPAEIWHAYMAAVTEGQPCVPFPPSKEAISYEPFYGKYASTGLALKQAKTAKNPAAIANIRTVVRELHQTAGPGQTVEAGTGAAGGAGGDRVEAWRGAKRAGRPPSGNPNREAGTPPSTGTTGATPNTPTGRAAPPTPAPEWPWSADGQRNAAGPGPR